MQLDYKHSLYFQRLIFLMLLLLRQVSKYSRQHPVLNHRQFVSIRQCNRPIFLITQCVCVNVRELILCLPLTNPTYYHYIYQTICLMSVNFFMFNQIMDLHHQTVTNTGCSEVIYLGRYLVKKEHSFAVKVRQRILLAETFIQKMCDVLVSFKYVSNKLRNFTTQNKK